MEEPSSYYCYAWTDMNYGLGSSSFMAWIKRIVQRTGMVNFGRKWLTDPYGQTMDRWTTGRDNGGQWQ